MSNNNVNTDGTNDPNEQIFRDYLHHLVDELVDNVAPKAREYGNTELAQLGVTLSHVAGQRVDNYNHATQNAVWFYASGKLARWTAAVARQQQPSRDTVYDLLVYCLMWLKVQETGEWWPERVSPQSVDDQPADDDKLSVLQELAKKTDVTYPRPTMEKAQVDRFLEAMRNHPAGKGLRSEEQILPSRQTPRYNDSEGDGQ